MSESASSWSTWGRLFRLPNLFTVPGDAVAGGLLVAGLTQPYRLPIGGVVVLCLYMGGLLLNDYFDRDEDARDRPERPIPSGAAAARRVVVVGAVLLAVGAAVAVGLGGTTCGLLALGICTCVVAYDSGGKRIALLGPGLMGACRAGSVLLGAAAVNGEFPGVVLLAAGTAFAYASCVTLIAADETSGKAPGPVSLLPAVVLAAAGAGAYFSFRGPACPWCTQALPLVILSFGAAEAVAAARSAMVGRCPVPPFIGQLIRIMITTQAFWCLWALRGEARWFSLVTLICFWGLRMGAERLGKRFYGS